MQVLISIIIPCYNQCNYLVDSLTSVLAQTYKNWECIVVNDGSTDNTEEIAVKICNGDDRFIYIKKQNGGLSSARNAGLKLVKGDFVQFLDCDDTITENKLELQLAKMSTHVDVVISDYFPFDHLTDEYVKTRYLSPFLDETNFKYDIIEYWEFHKSIPCHTVLFKTDLLSKDNALVLFDESLPNHEDWVFWAKLFYNSNGIFNLKMNLAHYRIHRHSMCADVNMMRKGFLKANKKLRNFYEGKHDQKAIALTYLKKKEIQFYYPTRWNNLRLQLSRKLKTLLKYQD